MQSLKKLTLTFLVLFLTASSFAQESQRFLPDGVSMDCINATVRFWRNVPGGRVFGSGFIFAETENDYAILTNHHVAEDSRRPEVKDANRGTYNMIDTWNVGNPLEVQKARTARSWYRVGASRDIALVYIPKSAFAGKMPIIPLAPLGKATPDLKKNDGSRRALKVGDPVIMIGCSDGRHPRARVGRVERITDQLIWYTPTSIGGDSGSAVFSIDGKYVVGQTAWATPMNINGTNKEVGLAMTSHYNRDVLSGRKSMASMTLPKGTRELEVNFTDVDDEALPAGARCIPKTVSGIASICDTDGVCGPENVGWRDPGSSQFRRPFRPFKPEPSPIEPPIEDDGDPFEAPPLDPPSEPEIPFDDEQPPIEHPIDNLPNPEGYRIEAPEIEAQLKRIADSLDQCQDAQFFGGGIFGNRKPEAPIKLPEDMDDVANSLKNIEQGVRDNGNSIGKVYRDMPKGNGGGGIFRLPDHEDIKEDYLFPILGPFLRWLMTRWWVWVALIAIVPVILNAWGAPIKIGWSIVWGFLSFWGGAIVKGWQKILTKKEPEPQSPPADLEAILSKMLDERLKAKE